jgi:hypothetical protein
MLNFLAIEPYFSTEVTPPQITCRECQAGNIIALQVGGMVCEDDPDMDLSAVDRSSQLFTVLSRHGSPTLPAGGKPPGIEASKLMGAVQPTD